MVSKTIFFIQDIKHYTFGCFLDKVSKQDCYSYSLIFMDIALKNACCIMLNDGHRGLTFFYC